MHLLTLWP